MADVGKENLYYPPSWFDRLSDRLETLPGPVWIAYLFLFAASCLAFTIDQAVQGAYTSSGFIPWHLFFAAQPVIFLAMMHYLDQAAGTALDRFRPVFGGSEAEYEQARYRLMTLPAGATGLATVGGILALLIFLGPTFIVIGGQPWGIGLDATTLETFGMSTNPASQWAVLAAFLILWCMIGTSLFHTVHQLIQIRRLFAGVTSIDPFNPEPAYAFSSVTTPTAVIMLLNSYGWVIRLSPGGSGAGGMDLLSAPMLVNVFFAALSIFLFVWPVWGAHRLLDSAKREALTLNAVHFKSVSNGLHRMVESGSVEGVDGWHKALDALRMERAQLEELPTWPWRPEASRGLVAAILIPLVIWLIQFVLERLLG